jgi:formyltetrahydrofolate synthetase
MDTLEERLKGRVKIYAETKDQLYNTLSQNEINCIDRGIIELNWVLKNIQEIDINIVKYIKWFKKETDKELQRISAINNKNNEWLMHRLTAQIDLCNLILELEW